MTEEKPRIFVSYSHEDKPWADRLLVHLRALAEAEIWTDSSIEPGSEWKREISKAIHRADVAIILVSANYLASDFVADNELPPLLESSARHGTLILPVAVSHVYIDNSSPLWQFQFANPPDKPLNALSKHEIDKVFVQIARTIRDSVRKPSAAGKAKELSSTDLADEIARRVIDLLPPAGDYEKRRPISTREQNSELKNKLIFVVMSFSEDMEPVFEGVEAAARSVGLEAKRVKDVQGDYRITDRVMEMIVSSRFIVVDLSHERPNVYFELGYARGLGKTIITIARRDAKIHFDVKDWTYIPYIDSRTLERELKERLSYELEREK